MSSRKKLNLNREFFRERCDEVEIADLYNNEEVRKVIQDLKDTLLGHRDLVAIAAPQIASRYRIFCMKFAGNDIRTFINPLIIRRDGVMLSQEQQIGFGMFDNNTYFTFRSKEITAGYQTPTGRVETNKFTDNASVVFEQMVQLLDGVFVSDFGLLKLKEWDELSKDAQREILEDYAKKIQTMSAKADAEVDKDEKAKRLKKLTDFYTQYALGNVEIAELTEEEKEAIRKKHEENGNA